MNTIKVINKSNNPLPKFETPGAAGADIRADFSRIHEYPIKVYGGAEVITSGEGHNKIMVNKTCFETVHRHLEMAPKLALRRGGIPR